MFMFHLARGTKRALAAAVNVVTNRAPDTLPELSWPRLLAGLVGLALACAKASTNRAVAASYSVEGGFDEGADSLGVAVNESTGDVYVADFFDGILQFDSSGSPVPPEPFAAGTRFAGVAVDPANRNVYGYVTETQEIDTFEPSGSRTELRHFTVNGGPNKFVQIATNEGGYIYYPNQKEGTVQEFEPGAEGGAPTPVRTFKGVDEGAGKEHALVKPQGVAVDSERGLVYIVDAGNGGDAPGRVQVFSASGNYEYTLDEGGSQDVAVDPVSGDVFVLDLNEEGSCGELSAPCYRIRAYHTGETTPFSEFGAGTVHDEGPPNHIAVDHTTGRVYVSDFEHKVWIFAPGTPPQVAYPTPAATGVSASAATLHGEVNPEGSETSCSFEYGTSESYEHSVPCEGEHGDFVGEGSKFKPESVRISALEANTEYHFRLVATTAAGSTVHGADQTFTTEQAPPGVLADSVFASDVTQDDVVFNATLNPQHIDTLYYFNYGLRPLEDSESSCVPPATVPYASAPAAPVNIGTSHSVSEELSGIAVEPLDLTSVNVVLHPGMGSRELQPNTAYHFQVVAESTAGASCEPEATFITLPPDPTASTGAASAITQTTANLVGAVTPGSTGPNSDTTWHFQYGTDANYGAGTVPATPGNAGMGTSAVAVSTAVEGLAPNTTYHYRLLASNANDDPAADPTVAPQLANGADRTLTTLPAEPVVGQPSGLSETDVTLNGELNPGGHKLEYRFQYGTTTAYGQSSMSEDAGESSEPTSVSALFTGLAPGTYHYRLVALGAGGDSYSPDSTFTLYAPAPAQTGNLFSPGQSTAPPFPTMPLLSTPTFPSVPTETAATPKPLTKGQKLAKALNACKKDRSKSKRKTCENHARRQYGLSQRRKKIAPERILSERRAPRGHQSTLRRR
jgi:hypothetical protein